MASETQLRGPRTGAQDSVVGQRLVGVGSRHLGVKFQPLGGGQVAVPGPDPLLARWVDSCEKWERVFPSIWGKLRGMGSLRRGVGSPRRGMGAARQDRPEPRRNPGLLTHGFMCSRSICPAERPGGDARGGCQMAWAKAGGGLGSKGVSLRGVSVLRCRSLRGALEPHRRGSAPACT